MTAPFSNVSIILVRPQHPGNIGAIARSISNHGLGRLVMVDPPAFDPDRARWMAPHASHVIDNALFAPNLSKATRKMHFIIGATARERSWNVPTLSLSEFCEKCNGNDEIGLLFGPEDSGLSNHDIQHCHALITLPTHEHKSLNLSQAVNVFGAHLMATCPQDTNAPSKEKSPSPKLQKHFQEELLSLSVQSLQWSGYNQSLPEGRLYNKLLRLLERANLSHGDIVTLKGMCNKIYHTLRVLRSSPKSRHL